MVGLIGTVLEIFGHHFEGVDQDVCEVAEEGFGVWDMLEDKYWFSWPHVGGIWRLFAAQSATFFVKLLLPILHRNCCGYFDGFYFIDCCYWCCCFIILLIGKDLKFVFNLLLFLLPIHHFPLIIIIKFPIFSKVEHFPYFFVQ